ncbi:uncharacterized protein I206_101264 [Kwoniella pini CBS 10737]|uniref:Pali-domain-containing protein n=1 Tax=Kwoniella pini CBS 10737 TaxID=1296096 RepID=A0A1B9IAV0_9TREE|nr:uncharacterized protein I206_00058 [Kwoniella pini CBS 10737]OCF52762.1 hypothetical protein I206_00058 [Kwoniella pini CBS 10737]
MAAGIKCGSFFLFAAFALLLVSSLSAPVFRQISFLDIQTGNQKLAFGVFGYCTNVNGNGNHGCSSRQLGYDIASISGEVSSFTYVNDNLEHITKALILHPIATGLTFISFIIALFSDRLGFIFAALIAFLAFLISLTAMIIDFVMFGIIKHEINNNTTTAEAKFENAIWLTLAAVIILFFSTFVVCFETFTNRRNQRSTTSTSTTTRRDKESGYVNGGYIGNQGSMINQNGGYVAPPPPKKHFWQRNRY